jgi:hypothetical protein
MYEGREGGRRGGGETGGKKKRERKERGMERVRETETERTWCVSGAEAQTFHYSVLPEMT